MMRRRTLAATPAALLLAHTARAAQTLRPIVVGLSSASFGTAAAPLAKALGLFAEHGLDAKLIVLDTANGATTALISRSVQFALSGPGELIAAQAHGQNVVVIANTYGGFSPTLVLAKRVADTLGVAATDPVTRRMRALDGLVIATTSATSASTIAFRATAAEAGASVRFTYMAQSTMVSALESQAVQGFMSSAPFWAIPVVKGEAVMWVSGPRGDLPPTFTSVTSGNLQVMRDAADADPGLVRQVVAVFDELAQVIEQRPADVKAALAKLYPNLDGPTLDLLFASESPLWRNRKLTPQDMAHELELVKASGVSLPGLSQIDPAALLYP